MKGGGLIYSQNVCFLLSGELDLVNETKGDAYPWYIHLLLGKLGLLSKREADANLIYWSVNLVW